MHDDNIFGSLNTREMIVLSETVNQSVYLSQKSLNMIEKSLSDGETAKQPYGQLVSCHLILKPNHDCLWKSATK